MTRTLSITHDGISYIAEGAMIESTFLGFEDHGIFTAVLRLSGHGWGQSTPGYALDGLGCSRYIQGILQGLGVNAWELLAGHRVLALRVEPYGGIVGLADLIDEEKIVIFSEIMKDDS